MLKKRGEKRHQQECRGALKRRRVYFKMKGGISLCACSRELKHEKKEAGGKEYITVSNLNMHDAHSLRQLLYSMHNISMCCLCNPEHVLICARTHTRTGRDNSHRLFHALRWHKKKSLLQIFTFCPLTAESFKSSSPLKIRAQSNQPCKSISPISS